MSNTNNSLGITVGDKNLVPDETKFSISLNNTTLITRHANGTVFNFLDFENIPSRIIVEGVEDNRVSNLGISKYNTGGIDILRAFPQHVIDVNSYNYTEDDAEEPVWYKTRTLFNNVDDILLNNQDEINNQNYWNHTHESIDGWIIRDTGDKIIVEKVLGDCIKEYLNDNTIDATQTLLDFVRENKNDVASCIHTGNLPELDRRYWVVTNDGINIGESWDAYCKDTIVAKKQEFLITILFYIGEAKVTNPDPEYSGSVLVHISPHTEIGDSLAHSLFAANEKTLYLFTVPGEEAIDISEQVVLTHPPYIRAIQVAWQEFTHVIKEHHHECVEASIDLDRSSVIDMNTYNVYVGGLDNIFNQPLPDNDLDNYIVLIKSVFTIMAAVYTDVNDRNEALTTLKDANPDFISIIDSTYNYSLRIYAIMQSEKFLPSQVELDKYFID